jgi:hypothetical protein
VSAAEQKSLGSGSGGEGLGEVDFQDFVSDRVIDPTLFDEGDEERTGFFACRQAKGVEGAGVGMRLDRGVGGEDEDVVLGRDGRRYERNAGALRVAQNDRHSCAVGENIHRGGEGGLGAGLDYADDGDGQGVLNVFKGESSGGVAGDDEEVGALAVKELCAGDGVAGDGLAGLGTVGQAGGVAQVDVVGPGDQGQQSAEDGEAAEAGVKDADGRLGCQLSVLRCEAS